MTKPYEEGEFTFPKTTFTKLRTALRRAYNKRRADQYALALTAYKALKEKHKRGASWATELRKILTDFRPMTLGELTKFHGESDPKLWTKKAPKVPVDLDPEGWIFDSIITLSSSGKPRKPLKKDFAPITAAMMKKGVVLKTGGLIYVRWSECQLRWEAEAETPHLLDLRREHPVAAVLFSRIQAVKRWGSGGGKIFRCDGTYVKDRFGK